MSAATIRYNNSLPLKSEILRELHYWKETFRNCSKKIKDNLAALKMSAAVAKREIHYARALMEEQLKHLEEKAVEDMREMVRAEEEVMKNFLQKLNERQKRMGLTETTLKDNVIGTKLKRTVEEGKQQIGVARNTLMELRKHPMAAKVEFDLHEKLASLVNGECTLGTATLKTILDEKVSKTNVADDNSTFLTGVDEFSDLDVDSNSTVITSSDGSCINLAKLAQDANPSSNNIQMLKDLENLLKVNISIATSSRSDCSKNKTSAFNGTKPVKDVTAAVKTPVKIEVSRLSESNGQKKNAYKRPQSSFVRTDTKFGQPDNPRLSKSARENSRVIISNNKYSSFSKEPSMESPFLPYEEQGPDRKSVRSYKGKQGVRYLGVDLVREITAQTIVSHEKLTPSYDHQPDTVVIPNRVPRASTRKINEPISSVSYKPSHANASGPVLVPAAQLKQSQSYFEYKARFHTKKHQDETDLCRIAGVVVLDSGQIIVSDINHLQIMLFSPEFTYLHHLECPSPCGLCIVSQNIVAVTLFHNRKILLVKVHEIHLERFKEIHINCPETLYGLSYQANHFFVLCFGGGIHVLDHEGRQERVIKTGVLGGEARHIEVGPEGLDIFITGHDRVICLSSESGDRLWQFRLSSKFSPGGIVLHNNRLFVTNWCNHKVLELSVDGTHVRDVITDNVEYPQAMAIHRQTARLFITQNNLFKQEARSRKIRVFNIK